MDLYVYSWACDELDKTSIRCFGIDENGATICIRIENFTPYVYVELPDSDWENVANQLKKQIARWTLLTEVVEKQHLYSCYNGSNKFLFCQCASRKFIGSISFFLKSNLVEGYSLKLHEESATSILQLVSMRSIPTATWIRFESLKRVDEYNKQTRCDSEFIIKWRNLKTSSRLDQVVPKVMAFDLEVNSEVSSAMPSNKPLDEIFQISCVLEKAGEKRKFLLTKTGSDLDSDLLNGISVLAFDTEEQLLIGFIEFLKNERPNVLTGYNILMFDISYLMSRCERYGLIEELCFAGMNAKVPAQEKRIKWSSSAFKNQHYHFIDWEGILILDLLPIIKRDYKFDNYKLDTVASNLIDAEKDPVHYKEIFAAFAEKKMARVGKYCVQDSNLCIDLLNHIHCWLSLAEMAVVSKVSMFAMYTQGQQVKIFSQVYDYCLRQNVVVTSNGYECKAGERYLGAFVMDPVPGYYENVVSLDVNSMYPSILIAYNICYSTFVDNNDTKTDPRDYVEFEWEDHLGCEHDPKIIEIDRLTKEIAKIDNKIREETEKRNCCQGAKNKAQVQKRINSLRQSQKPLREQRVELKKGKPGEHEDDDGNIISGIVCAKRKYRFLKHSVKPGVIPTIIQNLLSMRKVAKAAMKTCDSKDAIVFDKKQLAYKCSANSQYGAMGVRRGYLPFMPGAMCVTYMGRESIKKAGKLAVEKYGAKWIYTDTDSTYVIFPELTSPQEIWDRAIFVAKEISRQFPEAVNIEFENAIYVKFLILSKKKYAYLSADRDGNCSGKIGKKGIVLARRDNSGLLKTIYEKVIQLTFANLSSERIKDFVVDFINDIFRNKVQYCEYVVTKSIGSTEEGETGRLGDYKVKQLPIDESERQQVLNGMTERQFQIKSCPAHVQLAERMRLRGHPIDAGSRMEFVVLKNPKMKTLGGRMEDYGFFCKRRKILKLDKLYYLESLVNPLDQLLKVATGTEKFVETQTKIRTRFEAVLVELKQLFSTRIIYSEKKSRLTKRVVATEATVERIKKTVCFFNVHETWENLFEIETLKPYWKELSSFLDKERNEHVVFPSTDETFAWALFPASEIKVVIIGQDPYHGPGQAHGLAFSVKPHVDAPPSLKNIFQELRNEGWDKRTVNLSAWAKQGVLLLNRVLTVRMGSANSHAGIGWEKFTAAIIGWINNRLKNVAFLLWGKSAKECRVWIDAKKHLILTAAHPSPLSAHNGFFGCNHFLKCNEYLVSKGKLEINWAK